MRWAWPLQYHHVVHFLHYRSEKINWIYRAFFFSNWNHSSTSPVLWWPVITPVIHLYNFLSLTLFLFVEFQSDKPQSPQNIQSVTRGLLFCSNNVRNIYFKIQLKFFCLKNPWGNSSSLFRNCLLNFFPTGLLVCLNFASNLSF